MGRVKKCFFVDVERATLLESNAYENDNRLIISLPFFLSKDELQSSRFPYSYVALICSAMISKSIISCRTVEGDLLIIRPTAEFPHDYFDFKLVNYFEHDVMKDLQIKFPLWQQRFATNCLSFIARERAKGNEKIALQYEFVVQTIWQLQFPMLLSSSEENYYDVSVRIRQVIDQMDNYEKEGSILIAFRVNNVFDVDNIIEILRKNKNFRTVSLCAVQCTTNQLTRLLAACENVVNVSIFLTFDSEQAVQRDLLMKNWINSEKHTVKRLLIETSCQNSGQEIIPSASVQALLDNTTIQQVQFTSFNVSNSYWEEIAKDITFRNSFELNWKNVKLSIFELCFGLYSLYKEDEFPSYILLEIFDWFPSNRTFLRLPLKSIMHVLPPERKVSQILHTKKIIANVLKRQGLLSNARK